MDASYFISVAAYTSREASARIARPACNVHATTRLVVRSDCGVIPPLAPCRLDRDRRRGGPAYCCRASKGGGTKPAGQRAVNRKMDKLTAGQKLRLAAGGESSAAGDAH